MPSVPRASAAGCLPLLTVVGEGCPEGGVRGDGKKRKGSFGSLADSFAQDDKGGGLWPISVTLRIFRLFTEDNIEYRTMPSAVAQLGLIVESDRSPIPRPSRYGQSILRSWPDASGESVSVPFLPEESDEPNKNYNRYHTTRKSRHGRPSPWKTHTCSAPCRR